MIVGKEHDFNIEENGYYELIIHGKGVGNYNVSIKKTDGEKDIKYDLDKFIDIFEKTGHPGIDTTVKYFTAGKYTLDFEVENDIKIDELNEMDFEIVKIDELINYRKLTRINYDIANDQKISLSTVFDFREFLPSIGEKCVRFVPNESGLYRFTITQNVIDVAVYVNEVSVCQTTIEKNIYNSFDHGKLPEVYADDLSFEVELEKDVMYRIYFEFYKDTIATNLFKKLLMNERESLYSLISNTGSDEEEAILNNRIAEIEETLKKYNTDEDKDDKFTLSRNNWYNKVNFIGFDLHVKKI